MMRPNPIRACSAGAAASYYTRYLTDAPGEVPGVWGGSQATALGLTGEVSGDDLLAVLEGRDPVSGTPLGRPFRDRYFADGRVEHAVAGYDLTFSAPKSLSTLWALTQDEPLVRAHDQAVAAGMRHLERYGSTTRVRTQNGRLFPDSQGLTFAAFRQTTSRADDPQIHTHVVVSSKVQTDAGEWRALDAQYLFKHARVAGAIYQSVLRNELAHEFGIAWKPIVNGQAEMLGVPAELIAEFSKRSEQIDRVIADKVADFRNRQGREPNHWERAALQREAAEDTRGPKTGNGVPELVTRWRAEAAAVGWDAPGLFDALRVAARELGPEPDRIGLDEVVAALSTSGSAWNRAQVVWALCDAARPQPQLDGDQWADVIERVTDQIVDHCFELDPADSSAPRRKSDGRSMWLPPISTHITTEAILCEEEFVLTWAIDAQSDEPEVSATVRTDGLDVMQAGAAAAVAGHDRLVLVVGPAGAGKTTMLRAAVDDLASDGRVVFGVAPSAKAARVLERETGVPSDTLAKLLYEWSRNDRPPDPRSQLPVGTTVLVDEAGMVSTPALARLVGLAEEQGWRLALVGDDQQLQAVGRGGLFHELCATGQVHELVRIHRFREPWEAAASLLLRQGDPRALDAYIEHGRVHAGPFEEHLATTTEKWFEVAASGRRLAVVCSTNDHVDAANAAIQQARVQRGELDETTLTPIGGGERATVGDIVVTRRNDRTLVTTDGEPIRNREPWRVEAVGPDGSMTVSAIGGHGSAVLPPEYARQHVRLGYAATEHGYQGDTVMVGLELASAATTRRGLYSGATRGTDENHFLVVTETHDINEARDVLVGVLNADRSDVPAVAQRRELAQLDRAPQPARGREPRCEVPEWFEPLRAKVNSDLAEAERAEAAAESTRAERAAELAQAKEQLASAEGRLDPHRPALESADAQVDDASVRWRAANHEAMQTKGRQHRAAERESAAAKHYLDKARANQAKVEEAVAPERAAIAEATKKLRDLERSMRVDKVFDRWTSPANQVPQLKSLSTALDDWKRWANGAHLPESRLVTTITALGQATHPGCDLLAAKLAPIAPTPKIDPPTVELGIGL